MAAPAEGGFEAGEYEFTTSHHELQTLAKLKKRAKNVFGKVRYTKLSSFVYDGGDEDGRPVVSLRDLGDGDVIRCVYKLANMGGFW